MANTENFTQQLNNGHQAELLQTLFVTSNNLEDYVVGHPAGKDPRLAPAIEKVQQALALLAEAYSLAGQVEF